MQPTEIILLTSNTVAVCWGYYMVRSRRQERSRMTHWQRGVASACGARAGQRSSTAARHNKGFEPQLATFAQALRGPWSKVQLAPMARRHSALAVSQRVQGSASGTALAITTKCNTYLHHYGIIAFLPGSRYRPLLPVSNRYSRSWA